MCWPWRQLPARKVSGRVISQSRCPPSQVCSLPPLALLSGVRPSHVAKSRSVSGPMNCQHHLLALGFYLNSAHRGAANRLADRIGIGGVCFTEFWTGFDINSWQAPPISSPSDRSFTDPLARDSRKPHCTLGLVRTQSDRFPDLCGLSREYPILRTNLRHGYRALDPKHRLTSWHGRGSEDKVFRGQRRLTARPAQIKKALFPRENDPTRLRMLGCAPS